MPVRAANAHLASRSGGEDGPLRLAFDIPPKQPPRALAPVNTVLVEKSNQPKCHGTEGFRFANATASTAHVRRSKPESVAVSGSHWAPALALSCSSPLGSATVAATGFSLH